MGETVQRVDADHTNDDRAEHDVHGGEVLEQKLADKHVVFRHAAFLQEETERKPPRIATSSFLPLAAAGGASLDSFTTCPGSIIAACKSSSMAVAMPLMNMHATVSQDPAFSCSVPEMPWPLVRPPARRAAKAISTPPAKPMIARSAMPPSKNAAKKEGHPPRPARAAAR